VSELVERTWNQPVWRRPYRRRGRRPRAPHSPWRAHGPRGRPHDPRERKGVHLDL